MEFERRKKADTQINIAPLIDVVFQLLIFFALISHFVTDAGIKITLPIATTAQVYTQENIVIFITEDNLIYLNNEPVTLDKLNEKLSIKINQTKEKNVIIKADEKIDLGLAVKVMDIAKQAKAESLIISTKTAKDVN
ncbi:MAG: biopolymer transporter ExbD [Candidatus Omnitrophica bacterium]|nr:biopolymer transporter ExbD [Candidatus Omnitrophota bacterium]